jgi:hypothetical protein
LGLICSAVNVNLVCETDTVTPSSIATNNTGIASKKTFSPRSNIILDAISAVNSAASPPRRKKLLKTLSNLTNIKPAISLRNKKVKNIPTPLARSLL